METSVVDIRRRSMAGATLIKHATAEDEAALITANTKVSLGGAVTKYLCVAHA